MFNSYLGMKLKKETAIKLYQKKSQNNLVFGGILRHAVDSFKGFLAVLVYRETAFWLVQSSNLSGYMVIPEAC